MNHKYTIAHEPVPCDRCVNGYVDDSKVKCGTCGGDGIAAKEVCAVCGFDFDSCSGDEATGVQSTQLFRESAGR